MKKISLNTRLIIILAFCCILSILLSCKSDASEIRKSRNREYDFERVSIVTEGGWVYQVIKYKGHEYLCNTPNGGILHTESCKCKKSED